MDASFLKDYFDEDELLELFKGWQPKNLLRKRQAARLDQRVTTSITGEDKLRLQKEVDAARRAGAKDLSISQYIREKATGNVDIAQWAEPAQKALEELTETRRNQKRFLSRRRQLFSLLDVEDDDAQIRLFELEIASINARFVHLKAAKIPRPIRLTGRFSFKEREILVHRSQKLCLTLSDYLRMTVFGYLPNSDGDAHLGVDARLRFYASVLDVLRNGFGEPPNLADTDALKALSEENVKLREENRQLRLMLE